MEFYQAIKDCEMAIKLEPKTLKAYQNSGKWKCSNRWKWKKTFIKNTKYK